VPDGDFIVTLRPEPSEVPADVRLRRALKVLLRSYNLRAVDVRTGTAQSAARSVEDVRAGLAPFMGGEGGGR
jgi:hypothetical protein